MPVPHLRLLWLIALWFLAGVAAISYAEAAPIWYCLGAALLVFALADLLAGFRQKGRVRIERRVAHTLPVGTKQKVVLHLSAEKACAGHLLDRVSQTLRSEGLPLSFKLSSGQFMEAFYFLHLIERGLHTFPAIDLRLFSPLGLWLIPDTLEIKNQIRVFPNFARITQYALLASDNQLSQMGLVNRRRRGEGMEFHQLRDYRQEDSLRQIDWKASARMGHLISREYQDERDQRIVFLLDCGNRMNAKDGDLSHFDHSLNAMLLLSYVALKQGDAVGLSAFGLIEPRYLNPCKGVASVNRILNTVYDLQPTRQTPDYLLAAQALLCQLSRRSLIIVLTNLRDEDDNTLIPAMRLLSKRHLVTLVSLQEPLLDEILSASVRDFDRALLRVSAIQYAQSRKKQTARLRHQGVAMLDVAPANLHMALVNHYWERKRSGAI